MTTPVASDSDDALYAPTEQTGPQQQILDEDEILLLAVAQMVASGAFI